MQVTENRTTYELPYELASTSSQIDVTVITKDTSKMEFSYKDLKIAPPTKDYLWKDELNYEFVDGYSIIETDNNLGYIKITTDHVETKYVKKLEEDL